MTDNENLRKNLNEILANITPREVKVLRERFGIVLKDDLSLDEIKLSLDEMNKVFDVTRQRIREVEEKALVKLREKNNPSNNDDPDDVA